MASINHPARNQEFGSSGENAVASMLRANGHEVARMRDTDHYDLLVGRKYRVEVKTAKCGINGKWLVNFHRHGRLNELNVDIYIVRLENLPGFCAALYLLFRSPVRVKTMKFTLRSLLMNNGSNFHAFQKFCSKK